MYLILMVAACGGGGGGGGGGSNSTASDNSWLSQAQTNVVGSSSSSDLSGISVPDLSDCQSPAPAQANVVPTCVDDGPIHLATGQSLGSGNRAFVTVRLCVPGSTTQCVNVNHMIVDTGSTGIRVSVPALPVRVNLPAVTARDGTPVAECMHFISGWAWGSLNRADVYIGGLVARNMSIQMMESASTNPNLGGNGGGAFPIVPSACSKSDIDFNVGSIDRLRANGIIGVGPWLSDALNKFDQYFVCSSSACNATNDLDPASRPRHPAMHLPSFTGGVALRTEAIGQSGTRNVTGTLTFGVNALPTDAKRLALNNNGMFTTSVNGQIYPYSYIDSGTVGLFFDLASPPIRECILARYLYCPSAQLGLTAIQSDAEGNSHGISFEVANAESLFANNSEPTALRNLAGPTYDSYSPALPQRFAWGMPFFYGRTVYSLLVGTPLGGTYGAVAYTSP